MQKNTRTRKRCRMVSSLETRGCTNARVDHSDAFAIVTAAGCPLRQIWRIVDPGWRVLYTRQRVQRGRSQQQQRQRWQCGVTNDRVGGSRVFRPLIPAGPLYIVALRARRSPSRSAATLRLHPAGTTRASRHSSCRPLFRSSAGNIWTSPGHGLAIATTSQRRHGGYCAERLEKLWRFRVLLYTFLLQCILPSWWYRQHKINSSVFSCQGFSGAS